VVIFPITAFAINAEKPFRQHKKKDEKNNGKTTAGSAHGSNQDHFQESYKVTADNTAEY